MDEIILSGTEFARFRDLIYKTTGIAMSESKRPLVQSRLAKRLRANKLADFRDYYELVTKPDADPDEITAFINAVTTNKTDFFREPHHFAFVQNRFIPEMIQRVSQNKIAPRIRVWHAGCSTGEEPYTLAMTLKESLKGREWDVRQLASDIDTGVLAHAERGVYERERVAPVPEPLLRRWFLNGRNAQSGSVCVRPELRQQITFRRINLLDPQWPIRPDVKFDLIFCRNVVIYFDKPTQQQLFARFAERLRPGGYLFIGHSESLIGVSDRFENLGKTIYRLPDNAENRNTVTDRRLENTAGAAERRLANVEDATERRAA